MINSNKRTGSCNVLSAKTCVLKETKDINIKAFNIITNKNDAKAMTEHISCDFRFKCKFNSSTYNSNQKCNNKTCQCDNKLIACAKKNIAEI